MFVHSSDELYGADRILLDIYAAFHDDARSRPEFWLPTDVSMERPTLHGARGARSHRPPSGPPRPAPGLPYASGISCSCARLLLVPRLRRRRPALVYFTTSAASWAPRRPSCPAGTVGGARPGVLGPERGTCWVRARSCTGSSRSPGRSGTPFRPAPTATQVVLNATAGAGSGRPLERPTRDPSASWSPAGGTAGRGTAPCSSLGTRRFTWAACRPGWAAASGETVDVPSLVAD